MSRVPVWGRSGGYGRAPQLPLPHTRSAGIGERPDFGGRGAGRQRRLAGLVAPGGLALAALAAFLERPRLFAPHEAPFWDDPHIGAEMLRAHIDPAREAASRPHAVIDREVAWLVSHLGLRSCRSS
jgi:hypothetical protein